VNLIPPLQARLTLIPRADRSGESGVSECSALASFTGTRARLQLSDGGGRPLTWRAAAFAYLSPDPDGTTLAQESRASWSSPNGAIIPLAQDRAALVITDDTGRLDLDLPHTPQTRYLIVALPTGPVLISPPLHQPQ